MLAIVLKSREQLNIRQRGKKEHIAKMFLIRISLQSNTIILRCYFHQLLIWERTASPRPRWRSANAELRLDLKSVAAAAKHRREALCAAAKHRRSTLLSSKAQEKHCAQQLTALNMQAVPSAHDPTHFAYDSDICKPGFFVDASNVIRGGSVKQQMGVSTSRKCAMYQY